MEIPMKQLLFVSAVLTALVAQAQMPAPTPSPAGAEVYLIAPVDGATVQNPVTVRFGLKGMGVAPAGVQFDNTGHHHLFVDTDLPADMTKPIGMIDSKIIHFGKGQTETALNLTPGKHTLQLLLGDYLHTPHAPPVASKKITITVTR
jgi:hypothetical protein